jgi:uncharacterized protein
MYLEIPIHEQIEVLSLAGDFSAYRGKPTLHTPRVVGHRDGTASGEHVIEAVVFPTLEVFVTVDPVPLDKTYDPETDRILISPGSK